MKNSPLRRRNRHLPNGLAVVFGIVAVIGILAPRLIQADVVWDEPGANPPGGYSTTIDRLRFLDATSTDQQKKGSLIIGQTGGTSAICLNPVLYTDGYPLNGQDNLAECINSWDKAGSGLLDLSTLSGGGTSLGDYTQQQTGMVRLAPQKDSATFLGQKWGAAIYAPTSNVSPVALYATDSSGTTAYAGIFRGRLMAATPLNTGQFCLGSSSPWNAQTATGGCISSWRDLYYPTTTSRYLSLQANGLPLVPDTDTATSNLQIAMKRSVYVGQTLIIGTAVGLPIGTSCGDGVCNNGENNGSCPGDCPLAFVLTVSPEMEDGAAVTNEGTVRQTTPLPANRINCPGTCAATFLATTPATLSAAPTMGYAFLRWEIIAGATMVGACANNPQCNFTLNNNAQIRAIFQSAYTLTVSLDNDGSTLNKVTSASTPSINCGSVCSIVVTNGTSITLARSSTAPQPGYKFMGWSGGGCTGQGATCTVTMNQNLTVNAVFRKYYYLQVRDTSDDLTVFVDSVPLSAGVHCNLNSPASCTYPFVRDSAIEPSIVSLTHFPITSNLVKWTINGSDSVCPGFVDCVFPINSSLAAGDIITVLATFAPPATSTTSGSGGGGHIPFHMPFRELLADPPDFR